MVASSTFLCCFFFLFFCGCLCFFPRNVMATDHIVGANRGWRLPSEAGLNYSDWSASHTFRTNDEITFNYQRGLHSVFELNYSTYVNCSFNIWYGNDWIYNWTNRGGKTKLVLNETKVYYFACGMGNHCQQGMKVAVNVTNDESASLEKASQSSKNHPTSHALSLTTRGLFNALGLAQLLLLFLTS